MGVGQINASARTKDETFRTDPSTTKHTEGFPKREESIGLTHSASIQIAHVFTCPRSAREMYRDLERVCNGCRRALCLAPNIPDT